MSDVPGQGGGRPFLSARHVCSRPEGAHIGELSLTYAARLHRPYLDLGPLADGPLHSQSIHFAFAQLVHRVAPAMPLQNHPSPALRNAVVDEARLMHYRIARAAELSPRLRTDSWNLVVEHVERFPALGDDAQVRLIHLLEALGLYADIEEVLRRSPAGPLLSAKGSFAALKLRPSAATRRADAAVLARLAEDPAAEPCARLGAAGSLIVLAARTRPPLLAEAERWRAAGLVQLPQLDPGNCWLDAIYASAFWRAASYVPYLQRDPVRTSSELDEAERLARRIVGDDPTQCLLQKQNLHPLLETRVREAIEFGELELAVARAEELARLDPLDGKVQVRLGDGRFAGGNLEGALCAYQAAADLGAPFAALGSYNAGVCYEALGRQGAATDAFQRALHDAPAAFSAAQRLRASARASGDQERFLVAESSLRWMIECVRRSKSGAATGDQQSPARRPVGVQRPPALQIVREPDQRSALRPPDLGASGSLAGHLLRPYLDLVGNAGPNHARATRRLAELLTTEEPLPALQRHTATWLRPALSWEVEIPVYDVVDPRELPLLLQSMAWSNLCGAIDEWETMCPARRHRTALLLNRLGLYEMCVRLTSGRSDIEDGPTLVAAAVALFKVGRRTEGERLMTSVAASGTVDPNTRSASLMSMVVHHGKITHDLSELVRWVNAMEQYSVHPAGAIGAGEALINGSAALRARSFLPFHQGRHPATWMLLDEAEALAQDALRVLGDADVAARENKFALIETRLSAAGAFGDRARATYEAERLAAFEPLDGKSLLLLGQARFADRDVEGAAVSFLAATRLGAPYDAEAWHRHAACQTHLDDLAGAIGSYRRALAADPWAASSMIELHRTLSAYKSGSPLQRSLLGWCSERLALLRKQARQVREAQRSPPQVQAGWSQSDAAARVRETASLGSKNE